MDKEYSISFVRLIAMIMIICCHILQYFNNEFAWWLNVGVQIFLITSGYLYAKKKINKPFEFYKKEFIKILVPYYIYCFILIIIYKITNIEAISFINIIKLLLLIDTIKGVEHLWFIRYIIICYLLLPLIENIFYKKNIDIKELLKLTTIVLIIEIIGITIRKFINCTWINCFIISYFLSKHKEILKKRGIALLYIFLTTILTLIRVLLKYKYKVLLFGSKGWILNKFYNINHVMIGFLIFYSITSIYSYLEKNIVTKRPLLDLSDKYSYYIYITHHIYVLGTISVFSFLKTPIAIIIFAFLTILSSIILRWLSLILLKKKKYNNLS